MNYAEIAESTDAVLQSIGHDPKRRGQVKDAVRAECDKHNDSKEVREAVVMTVLARLDNASKNSRKDREVRSVVDDELPEPHYPNLYEYAFPYPVGREDEVREVFERARKVKTLGAARTLLVDSARARLGQACYYRDAGKGKDMMLVRATANEHGVLRLAGIEGKL